MNKLTRRVSEKELATILAALRFYQRAKDQDPTGLPNWTGEIASNQEEFKPLDGEAIDRLCENLNFGPAT
jgi:hypothetical protein